MRSNFARPIIPLIPDLKIEMSAIDVWKMFLFRLRDNDVGLFKIQVIFVCVQGTCFFNYRTVLYILVCTDIFFTFSIL